MGSYLDIANSGIIYLLAAVVIVVVMMQSIYFLKMAWKQGQAIGLSSEKMKKTIKSSAVFSVIPSLPIVVSLIAIAPVLGVPFTWLRLSVIGSNSYELIAAKIGANAMGFEKLTDPGYNAQAFSSSMWVMTVGIIWGIIMCIFVLKKWQKKMKDVATKDNVWGKLLMNALFFGMLTVFLGRPIAEGGLGLYVLLSSAAIMTLLTVVSKKLNIRWIGDFALSISMVAGMAMAIVFTQLGVS